MLNAGGVEEQLHTVAGDEHHDARDVPVAAKFIGDQRGIRGGTLHLGEAVVVVLDGEDAEVHDGPSEPPFSK